MLRLLTSRALSLLWTSCAVVAVTCAVLVTALRFALPHVDHYRPRFEQWLSSYMGNTVVISEMSARWSGWTPRFRFKNIELRDAGDDRTITRFHDASIELDILASIGRAALVPGRLAVSGVQLNIIKGHDGTVTIEGVDEADADGAQGQRNTLVEWLLGQRELVVRSAQVTWIDRLTGQTPAVFPDVTLEIRSERDHRQISGRAELPAGLGEALHFELDTRGDLLTEAWAGELYLSARSIDLPNFMAAFDLDRSRAPLSGDLGFELWTDWSQARVTSLQGSFELAALRATDTTLATRMSGRVAARRHGEQSWLLALGEVDVAADGGSARIEEARLLLEHDAGALAITGEISSLPLGELLPQLAGTLIPEGNPLRILRSRGRLENIRFRYRPAAPAAERFYLASDFHDLATARQEPLAGLAGLSGRLHAWPNHGTLHVGSRALELDWVPTIPQRIAIESLSGEIGWQRRDGGWRVDVPALELHNPDIRIEISGRLLTREHARPFVDLRANAFDVDLQRVHKYLPLGIAHEFPHYLNRAVIDGRIPWAGAVLRGSLGDFPFDEQEGKFEIRVRIADGVMRYARRWPTLENFQGEALLSGRDLQVREASGTVMATAITGAHARVDNVLERGRVLEIEGRARASSLATLDFLDASPLRERVGRRVRATDLRGDLALDMTLTIPMKARKALVDGRLHLLGNSLEAVDLGISLSDARGAIDFTHKRWRGRDLDARWHGAPVTVRLGNDTADGSEYFELEGTSDVPFLSARLADLAPAAGDWAGRRGLLDALRGTAGWTARLEQPGGQPAGGKRLRIHSDLTGLAMALPEPVGKRAAEARDLDVDIHFATRQWDIRLGERLRVLLDYDEADERRALRAAYVGLGDSAAYPLPDTIDGLSVRGRLRRAQAAEWAPLLTPPDTGRALEGGLSRDVELFVERLDLYGQMLDNATLTINGQGGSNELSITSAQISGTLRQSPDDRTIVGDFQRIVIQSRDRADASVIDPSRIPPLRISCSHFAYDALELGRLDVDTAADENGMQITRLELGNDALQVAASGSWTSAAAGNQSRFEIDVHGDDLGQLLRALDYDAANVVGGKTRLHIDARWPGGPADFELARLDGRIQIDVDEGRFLDLDPKGGRLFGLLSLQMLPRRLSLDFSDLTDRGFSFDQIRGSFSVTEGDAYTNALQMDGPAARVVVSGRVGLAAEDYDQTVVVSPQVSDSLPVASAMFGPAGVGVGAAFLVVGKVFKGLPDGIDSILSREYSVTGPWQDPVVEQIVAQRPDAPDAPGGGVVDE